MGFWSEVAKVVSAPAKVVEKVVSGAGKAVARRLSSVIVSRISLEG